MSYRIFHSRFGEGLLAIHDDEDVAEVKGVPTFRYKLMAFAISSAVAGMMGGIHAVYVGYVTVGETFAVTVPLYVVLMSILGGARHWAGPAIGATLITVMQSAVVGGAHAELGRAGVALALIVVILTLPSGIVPGLLRMLSSAGSRDRRGKFRPLPSRKSRPWRRSRRPRGARASGVQGRGQVLRRHPRAERRHPRRAGRRDPCPGRAQRVGQVHAHQHDQRAFPGRARASILLEGRAITGLPPHEIAQSGIARTYQIPRLFNNLTILENVRLCAEFGGVPPPMTRTRQPASGWPSPA